MKKEKLTILSFLETIKLKTIMCWNLIGESSVLYRNYTSVVSTILITFAHGSRKNHTFKILMIKNYATDPTCFLYWCITICSAKIWQLKKKKKKGQNSAGYLMFICLSHTLYTLHFVYEHVILLRGERKKKACQSLNSWFLFRLSAV